MLERCSLMLPKGLLIALVVCLGVGSGCALHHHHRRASAPAPRIVAKNGPPPHAPAHGYRYKHTQHGVDLVFDSGIGLYIVVGHTGVYSDGTRYYRLSGDAWQVSLHPRSDWAGMATKDLPRGLRVQAKGKAKVKRRGRPHPPAKHGY